MRNFPPDAEGDAGGGDQDGDSDSEVNRYSSFTAGLVVASIIS